MHLKKYLTIISLLLTTSVFANDVEIVKVVLTHQTGTWQVAVSRRYRLR